MLVAQGKHRMSSSPENILSMAQSDVAKKAILGYDFKFADWEGRYRREVEAGKIVEITNGIGINKQSIQSVENSIYDKELGDLTDTDKDIREFSCDCGELYGRFYEGMTCPECGTKVISRFAMDIRRCGWINIEPFCIINPNAYELIGKCIGNKNLQKILQYDIQIDLEGKLSQDTLKNIGTTKIIPYANSGMIEFRNNFTERRW